MQLTLSTIDQAQQTHRISFYDFLGHKAMIQESLNKNKPKIHLGIQDDEGSQTLVLTPEMIKFLLPYLEHFAVHGSLCKTEIRKGNKSV